MSLTKQCKNCGQNFVITKEDQAFYQKVNVPPPTFCPECRLQRRLAFRNERSLYQRKCDLCKKEIIACYPQVAPFPVYCPKCWWSDACDPLSLGRDFDFKKPFFEQFRSLLEKVPRLNLYVKNCENCEFTNIVLQCKNCYLLYGSAFCESCFYCKHIFNSDFSLDLIFCGHCLECYELVDCHYCYRTFFSQKSERCKNSWFLYDCRNCENCVGCWNLRNKKYYLFNRLSSKSEIEEFIKNNFGGNSGIEKFFQKFRGKLNKEAIHKFQIGKNNQNVSGDFIYNSKNSFNSYNIYNCEDVSYAVICLNQKSSCDIMGTGLGELAYECLNNDYPYQTKFCLNCTNLNESEYCESCHGSDHLFGCIGLRHKDHCILNKKYSPVEYEKLLPKIKEHLEKTGEYGEFYPISISPYAYNETVAQEYFPLTKKEARAKGYRWRENEQAAGEKIREQSSSPMVKSPDILTCASCGKNYQLIEPEIKFYRKMNLPFPEKCPNCRHHARFKLKSPLKLWNRNCEKCGREIKTSYPPVRPATPSIRSAGLSTRLAGPSIRPADTSAVRQSVPNCPQKVYCEKCYLESVV